VRQIIVATDPKKPRTAGQLPNISKSEIRYIAKYVPLATSNEIDNL
jgi:hypothetical protein